MGIEVGVDTADNNTASFYDGHGHPFSPYVRGWRGRPVKEVTVISARANRAVHHPSGAGRAVSVVRDWLTRQRDPAARKVRPKPRCVRRS